MIKIENWYVVAIPYSTYSPPESITQHLCGEVYGHSRFNDGELVTTSEIINVIDNRVYTYSGSIYELGEPKADYVKECKEKGWHVPTKLEPIKFHKKVS